MQICKVLKAGSPGLPEPKPRRMLVLCKQVVGEGLSTRGVVLREGGRHHLSVAAGGDKKRTKRGHGRDKKGMSHLSQHFLGCLWLLPLQPLPREQRAAANRGGSRVTVSGVWAGGGPLGPGAALWGCGRDYGVLGEGVVLGCSYKSSRCARGFGAGSNPEVRLELSQLPSTRSAVMCWDGGKIPSESKSLCMAGQAGREGAQSRLGCARVARAWWGHYGG